MPYIHFTEEQKLRASEVDLVEFLRRQGEKLIRSGPEHRLASDHIKRMMNQAIFSKLWIESDGRVTAEFREPFKTVVEPISTLVAQFNQQKIRGAEALTDFLSVISNRIQKFFGCGWSNDFLVPGTGLEPAPDCSD